MDDIVQNVDRVAQVITEITQATQTQQAQIAHVMRSVEELEQMTQQNASLVEESSAASASLHDQALTLDHAVKQFEMPAGNADIEAASEPQAAAVKDNAAPFKDRLGLFQQSPATT